MEYHHKKYTIYQCIQEKRAQLDKSQPEVRLRLFGTTVIAKTESKRCIEQLRAEFPNLAVRHAYDPNAKYLIVSI